jgi:predicted HTH transcriptional regulator
VFLARLDRLPLVTLTARQEELIDMAKQHGFVCRRAVMARYHVCGEAARRWLLSLVARGILQRVGQGRATRYVPTVEKREQGDLHGAFGADDDRGSTMSRQGLESWTR